MTERPTFRPIGESDERLYGPRKLVLLGFSAAEQPSVTHLVRETLGLVDLPVVFVTREDRHRSLGELFALEKGPGEGLDSQAPRVFLMGGVTERELHALMDAYGETGLPRPLWACITPVSEKWPLRQVVSDLLAEHAAMARGQEPAGNRPAGP